MNRSATLSIAFVATLACAWWAPSFGQSTGNAAQGQSHYNSLGCNQCHGPDPRVGDATVGTLNPVLLSGARDPNWIDYALNLFTPQGYAASIDALPNAAEILGDIGEFIYACKITPLPAACDLTEGAGGGGGSGGSTPGQLQASGSMAFGNQPLGSTSAPHTLTLTNVGSGTVTVASVTTDNATEFPITGNTCSVLTQSVFCEITFKFSPSAIGARTATVTVTSDGMFSPQTFVFTGNGMPAGAVNYEGLWWNPSEAGWGINFEHQGNTIFATWFTYDLAGKAWWLVMTAEAGAGNTFTGTLYKTTGSPYSSATFAAGSRVSVGTGTVTFTDASNATFTSSVNAGSGNVMQTKSITRQVFGTLPTCTYGTAPNLAGATNYQGLWWNASESGWGINFAHEGTTIFATWFTFDVDGSPLWLVATMPKGAGETFAGTLYRVTATPFGATPFAENTPVSVGTASLAFVNGNSATFSYTVLGTPVTKQLTRQLFAPPAATLCQ